MTDETEHSYPPNRGYRVDDETHRAVRQRSLDTGETVSVIVTRALRRYLGIDTEERSR